MLQNIFQNEAQNDRNFNPLLELFQSKKFMITEMCVWQTVRYWNTVEKRDNEHNWLTFRRFQLGSVRWEERVNSESNKPPKDDSHPDTKKVLHQKFNIIKWEQLNELWALLFAPPAIFFCLFIQLSNVSKIFFVQLWKFNPAIRKMRQKSSKYFAS